MVARLELQSSQFQSELEKTNRKLLGFQQQATKSLSFVEKQARAFGRSLAGLFAGLTLAGAAGAVRQAIELGDEIGKAAVKAGIGTEAMSELAFAARMADVDMAALSSSIRFMQVALSKAASGGKEQAQTLAALGLKIEDIKGLAADKQFESLADAIASLRSPADRARAATELFGRAGAELLPLFEKGAEGIRKAREEAERLGLSFGEQQIRLLQQGDDAIKKLSAAWDGWMSKLAIGTLHFAQALDLIGRDRVGELRDELARVNEELKRIPVSAELGGTPLDPERWAELTSRAKALQSQIANLNDAYTRGGGSRRGRGRPSAPGFENAASGPGAFTGSDFSALMNGSELRRNIADMQEWRDLVDEIDHGISDGLVDANKELAQSLDGVEEPVLNLSNSLIQADELQKEFTRSMFENVSNLFMSIGEGADNFADAFINSIKRIISDRATLEFFNLMGGLGASLTGSSGGKGFAGFIGAGLSSLFGGGMAEGGPLQQGKWYMAGEHGPEPIWGGGPGAFAMGYGGGGINVTVHNQFNNVRDLSDAKMSVYAKKISDVTVARIRDERRHGKF